MCDLGHDVIAHEVSIATVGAATLEHRPDIAMSPCTRTPSTRSSSSARSSRRPSARYRARGRRGSRLRGGGRSRGVFAYIDSTKETELQGAIDVALQRYHQFSELLRAFERRARIERAKGILMERHALGDREAFERIRRAARDARRPLIDVVDEVLATDPG